MRVLVATTDTQGDRSDDYCWTVEGELVRLPGLTCEDPRCGCTRGFAGLTSSRATTTAKVAELDTDRAVVRAAFLDTLRREQWLQPAENPGWLDEFVDFHLEVASGAPVGTVFELRPDEVRVRRRSDGCVA